MPHQPQVPHVNQVPSLLPGGGQADTYGSHRARVMSCLPWLSLEENPNLSRAAYPAALAGGPETHVCLEPEGAISRIPSISMGFVGVYPTLLTTRPR